MRIGSGIFVADRWLVVHERPFVVVWSVAWTLLSKGDTPPMTTPNPSEMTVYEVFEEKATDIADLAANGQRYRDTADQIYKALKAARRSGLEDADKAVCARWNAKVKEWGLLPGSRVEEFVSELLLAIRRIAEEGE